MMKNVNGVKSNYLERASGYRKLEEKEKKEKKKKMREEEKKKKRKKEKRRVRMKCIYRRETIHVI